MDTNTTGYETTSSASATSTNPSNANKISIPNMDGASNSNFTNDSNNLVTPKKSFLDSTILDQIRRQLLTPGGCNDIQSLRINSPINSKHLNIIKDRYVLSSPSSFAKANDNDYGIPNRIIMENEVQQADGSANVVINTLYTQKAKTSYSHLPEISSSNIKCIDIYTEENYSCRIINEPIGKVQLAYFRLMQSDLIQSEMYGHNLIRKVHDLVPLSKNRTYAVIPILDSGYENLHTYIRNKRRLHETEARNIFRQILQTVQVCHASGVILRDLKLKRFFFIDEERTQIQYESLDGSIILDDPEDDTMYEKIGCPLYTAPELLCTDTTYLGKPADMWSLGVILYTILVGQYPFNEKNGQNLLTNIRNCNMIIPIPLSIKSKCLIRCLLRKNPKERVMAEDTFYHPWLMQSSSYAWEEPSENSINDQRVPGYEGDVSMYDDDSPDS